MFVISYSFVPLAYIFSHSTFIEIYMWLLTEKLWTNLHCYGPPKEQKSHRKHTRYKYIRRKQHIGTRVLSTICTVVAAHRTAPPWNSKDSCSSSFNMESSTYVAATHNITYNISRHRRSSNSGALIDRGANGGIAGHNVRIIATTDRHVDIQGVSNHQVVDVPIVTCGAVVKTQRGEAILIMNQYAHVRNGKTIHSCIQMESHGQSIDDKAIAAGGKQQVVTADGYAIPLHVREGLVYMDMRPHTDSEFERLPHIILTSDLQWDPSVMDHENDDVQWFDAVEELEEVHADSPFYDI